MKLMSGMFGGGGGRSRGLVCVVVLVAASLACVGPPGLGGGLMGCSADSVNKAVDAMEPRVEAAAEYAVKTSAILDKVASGELSESSALVLLRSFLKVEDQAKLDAAVAKAQGLASSLKDVVSGATAAALELKGEFAKLKAEAATKKAGDDMTWSVVQSGFGLAATLLGGGAAGSLITGIMGFFSKKKAVASAVGGAVKTVGENITITPAEHGDLWKASPTLAAMLPPDLQ